MKVLLIDYLGVALDFAMQCQNAGHDVRVWIGPDKETKERVPTGDGIITRVADFKPSLHWADLIWMSDNAYVMDDIEHFHKRGYPIFGPNKVGAALELERQTGQDAFKKAGFAVMGGTEFTDYTEAQKFVLSRGGKWVSKPDGDVDKALSYVAKDESKMLHKLERWKTTQPSGRPFILQEFCPGLCEMAVGGWFGKNGWLKGWCENFEFKKAFAGDTGPNCGEAGTVLKYVKDSRLADQMLLPLTDMLKKIGYLGYLDVATIIDEEGVPRPLEFTTRPGWPCFIIQSSLHRGDPCQWMLDALEGRDTLDYVDEIATGVVIAAGDFPYGHLSRKEVSGDPVAVREEEITQNVHLCEVMMGEAWHMEDDKPVFGDTLVTSGDYVAVCTGSDYSIAGSAKRAYRAVKKIELVETPTYRNDIGRRLEDQLPKVQEFGYATDGWEYE